MSNSYFLKTILHFMQFFQQYKSSIFQKLSFTKSYWEVNINERSSLESMFWFSHLCNYKCCIPGYINLVAKFLNFLKDFTPTLYNFFFLLASTICHYAITCRKTEKIPGKIKGKHWWRPIQGKRVKTSHIEKARKSWFDTRERQRMTKMVPRTKKGW